ncbi:riboflavin kinase [Leucobacter sp. UCD-THU]|jgi:riboflavin kinase/FMN adenylyltransferase|uniref:Riboflavin biosynthesis protein n=1 Tax=Leucobacter muris TaxID=1935379 RepID=A0ABX5QCS5_9MICO|nr:MULTISPECIES: bifunctional riboflavin kinase/FAD synthetase [Leucobacter]EYT54106.1 riboflavin kinase [Leucobacter sp. UCD-THU]QAB16841.1 bifunctional riboflavin kinase/FAD synthetase [Leucobacter muris]
MRVIETLEAIRPADYPEGSGVAIGKFDGLHLGHRAILRTLIEGAHAAGRPAVVLTFANNPLSLLRPELCPRPLMSREQRLEGFEAAGVDDCVMIEFDEAVASIPAADFVRDVLVGRLRAKHIIMGADFRFGHRGAGDGGLLRELGERYGFKAETLQLVAADGTGEVSSSRVREAVLAGDVEAAGRMLGRSPVVRGEVVRGDARGREIGFPTANLGGEIEGLVPADGVYAGWAVLGDDDADPRPAAISVGNNPTFTPDALSRVEAFLLDFSGDLYGQRIEVRFAHRLRGMERYDSLDALLEQMRADVVRTRELLSR